MKIVTHPSIKSYFNADESRHEVEQAWCIFTIGLLNSSSLGALNGVISQKRSFDEQLQRVLFVRFGNF